MILPMVIMDLIQLTAKHEKVICENDIDIDSIIPFITHAVKISNDKTWDNFYDRYESEIRCRDISEDEKEKLIQKVNAQRAKTKREISRKTTQYGIKQIIWGDHSTVEQTADEIADYFGLSNMAGNSPDRSPKK